MCERALSPNVTALSDVVPQTLSRGLGAVLERERKHSLLVHMSYRQWGRKKVQWSTTFEVTMSFDSTDIDGLGKVDMQESERKKMDGGDSVKSRVTHQPM
jgi:hypothetical protein